MGTFTDRQKRTELFSTNRFGMFIHWGLYAIPARGEWLRSNEKMAIDDYNTYFEEFNPVRYDPRAWAKLAKEAGMKYAVLTAKHHDGFCLFDSQYTSYKSTNTPCKRDLVREYVEAFRSEGIQVGLYYSLLDWYHPDFPHYGDRQHPMRDNDDYRDVTHNWENYLTYFHNQVRELLTNYGKIDLLWFDFSYENERLKGTQFESMSGETWKSKELVAMIRSLQPDIVIDNRLGGDAKKEEPDDFSGDFVSPECMMPAQGATDVLGRAIPWELCLTLNDSWGYTKNLPWQYKTPQNVIHMLVECVSKGGNMLINVGPNAKGEIPKDSIRVLQEIGEWMRVNGESIYGCGNCSLVKKPEWGRYTQNGNKIYAHIYDRRVGAFRFEGLAGKVKKARLLADGSEMKICTPWNAGECENDIFIDLGISGLYDDLDTVIELELQA